jgi:hypothetical protein
VSFFSFPSATLEEGTKCRAWEGDGRRELVPVEAGRWQGKGIGGCIQCPKCVHMYVNEKMIPVKTILGMGKNKGEQWRGELKYDIFDTLQELL